MHIRKDDQVEVITGDDKGTPDERRFAKVLRVLTSREQDRRRGGQPRLQAHEAQPEEPPGGAALQGDADRRLQRHAGLPQVQPRGPRRPPVHRRRPEAALLQVVRPGLGNIGPRKPAHAGWLQEETLISRPTFPRRRRTGAEHATRGGIEGKRVWLACSISTRTTSPRRWPPSSTSTTPWRSPGSTRS